MRRSSTLLFALTIVLAAGTCDYYFGLFLPESRRHSQARQMSVRYSYGGDFYPIWLTGRALFQQRTNPYTPETTRDIQIGLYGRPMDLHHPGDFPPSYRAFSYPIYADLLAAPLLPFRFELVRLVLTLILLSLTVVSVILWLGATRIRFSRTNLAIAVILTLISYPVLEGLYAGQAGLLVGAAIALSVYALTKDRPWLAGVALAIAAAKPQMMLLLCIYLFFFWPLSQWQRRKAFFFSFTGSMFILVAASEVILPGWFSGWWHAVTEYSTYTTMPLPQLVLGRPFGTSVSFALLAFAIAVAWRTRTEPAPTDTFLLAVILILAVTVLLLPTADEVYDQVLLLPAILWGISRRKQLWNGRLPWRILAITGVVALSWQWLPPTLVALCGLVSPAWEHSQILLALPLRLAASLPFVVFAIVSWFAIRAIWITRKDRATTSVALTPP
jgi:hypothetical protein